MRTRQDRSRRVTRRGASPRRLRPTIETIEDRLLPSGAAATLPAVLDHAAPAAPSNPVNLNVGVTVDNATPNLGTNVVYTITVNNNNGLADATNLQLTDVLPNGLKFVSSNPNGGTYNSGTGVWNVGSLPKGTTDTLKITAQVLLGGTKVDTASVTAVDEPDNNSNPSASVSITPNVTSLSIGMTLDSKTPNVKNAADNGDTATFTIIVSNDTGYAQATGVQVKDLLPSGLTLVTTPSGYNPGTGIWNVGTLNAGQVATLTLAVTDTSLSTLTNTATITAVNQLDANNNPGQSASAQITAQEVNLSVSESADNTAPGVGAVVTFTTTVSNASGLSDAKNVQVVQILPAGLTYVDSTPSNTYNPSTGSWSLGTLASGATDTLTLKARVLTTANRTVTSTASASQYDANSTPSDSVNLVPPQIDLSLGAAVDNPAPNVNDTVTYTFTLGNAAGFSDASGVSVQLTHPLPSSLSFLSATPTQGSYSSSTGLWTVGALNAGSSVSLALKVKVTGAGSATVSGTASATQTDANTNPTASATVAPVIANIGIAQTVDNASPAVGGQVTFTITVKEAAGAAKATGVTVGEVLDPGLTFVKAIPSQGSYSGGVWTVGTVAGGGSATLKVVATDTVAATALKSTATVTHVDQFVTGLPSASATVTARQVNLSILDQVDKPSPAVGSNVTFSVSVNNLGGASFSDASDVLVTDRLPAGLAYVSSISTQGTYNPATGLWAVGTLPKGSTAFLKITAQVINGGTSTDTATITDSVPTNVGAVSTSSIGVTAPTFSLSDLSQISYLINGTKTVTTLAGNVHPGDRVTATFTVAPGHTDPITLVSYVVPGTLFFVNPAGQQVVFQASSGSFSAGTHSLSVIVPNSFFQLDLAFGPVIALPGPAGATASYAAQGRLISGASGGFFALGTSRVSGTVFVDGNNDGVKQWYEAGLSGVPLELKGTDYLGQPVALFTTSGFGGSYSFTNVPASGPGGYTILNLLSNNTPLSAQYVGGKDSAGSLGGVAGTDQIAQIFVNGNESGANYLFGVKKKP